MREGIAAVMEHVRNRSAIACMNAPMPADPPKGNQQFQFEVGQTVYSTGVGPLKGGIAIVVTGRYEDHGYCYYEGYAGTHREKDLTANSPKMPTGVVKYKVMLTGNKTIMVDASSLAAAIDQARAQGKWPVAAML